MRWSWWRQRKKAVRDLIVGDKILIDGSEYTIASLHYLNGHNGTPMVLTLAQGKTACLMQLTFVGINKPFYASPAMMLNLAAEQ